MRGTVAGGIAAFAVAWASAGATAAEPFTPPQGASASEEMNGERTRYTRTWRSGNERVTRISQDPIHWRDDRGRWRRFDLRLHPDGSGERFDSSIGDATASFPRDLATDPGLVVRARGHELRLGLERATGVAQIEAAETLAYEDRDRGITQRLTTTTSGVKEELVLQSAASPRTFTYTLRLSRGLRPEVAPSGDVTVADRAGAGVFTIPRGFMFEEDEPADTAELEPFELDRQGPRSWRLRLDADTAWLDDRSRSWPVVVDPTVTIDHLLPVQTKEGHSLFPASAVDSGRLFDIPVECVSGTVNGGFFPPGELRVGSNGTTVSRAHFDFELPGILNGVVVTDARLGVPISSASATPASLSVHRNTSGMFCNRIEGDSPSFAPVPLDQRLVQNGRTEHFDVLPAVRGWLANRAEPSRGFVQRGLTLKATSERTPRNPTAPLIDVRVPSSFQLFPEFPGPTAYLDVYSTAPAQAGSQVELPAEGAMTSRFVELRAEATSENVTTARFEYFDAAGDAWRAIPLSALRMKDTGAQPAQQDVPVTDQRSARMVWDLQATPGGQLDGPFQVRAMLDAGNGVGGGITDVRNFRVDRKNPVTSSFAGMGPGEVDLLTGDFVMARTDATMKAFLSDLELSRTYHSRGGSPRTSELFGPGWQASVEADGGDMPYRGIYDFTRVDESQEIVAWLLDVSAVDYEMFDPADLAIMPLYETKRTETRYAVLELVDGSKITFRREDGGWRVSEGSTGLTLTADGGDAGFVVTDVNGAVASFVADAPGSPNYRPTSYESPGSDRVVTYQYESVAGRKRLKRVVAPNVENATCTGATPAAACRMLELNWISVTTAAGPVARVGEVLLRTGSSATAVATYSYDGTARLTRVEDPRTGLAEQYAYSTQGLVTTVTPAGEQPWRIAYGPIPGDDNPARARSVTRRRPNGQDATWTLGYDVPTSGPNAPNELSFAAVRQWSQFDRPMTGTAIFGPDHPQTGSSDWTGATIYYVGSHGKTVNVADPLGNISTTEYDRNGNVIRELSPGNRLRALASPDSAARAQLLDRQVAYHANGIDIVDEVGPEHEIRRPDGSTALARTHKRVLYDFGAPTRESYHLPTEIRQGALLTASRTNVDEEVTRYEYAEGGSNRGWEVRRPLRVIRTDGSTTITERFGYHPTYPLLTEHRTANSNGADAGTTRYHYNGVNTAGINPAWCPDTSAGTWGGLICASIPAGQPPTGPPVLGHSYRYTSLWDSQIQAEVAGLATGAFDIVRNTVTGRDAAGRPTQVSVGGSGDAIPMTTTTYSPTTGRTLTTRTAAHGSEPARTLSRSYDDNGQLTTYVDADGHTTTYTYDIEGREVEVIDPSGTRTIGYDLAGRIDTIEDSKLPGPITARYDADDGMVEQTLPNGLRATTAYNANGDETSLEWERTTGCAVDCTWVSSAVERNAQGRIVRHESLRARQSYEYDGIGRLRSSEEWRGDRCTVRGYVYDGNSNRTSMSRQVSAVGGACGTGTLTTTASAIDAGDRIISPGFEYDALNRTTRVPASHMDGEGQLTSTFASDDFVSSLTRPGERTTFARDPLRRTRVTTSRSDDGSGRVQTLHYASDADEPISARTDQVACETTSSGENCTTTPGESERYVEGPGGDLLATVTGDEPEYQLANLRGNVVATASDDATAPESEVEYDEFGGDVWQSGRAPARELTPAWTGSAYRFSSFGAGGPVHMGVRTYLPSLGRFTQTDPADGGAANRYDFAYQDPLNNADLSGSCAPFCVIAAVSAGRLVFVGAVAIFATGVVVTATQCVDMNLPTLAELAKSDPLGPTGPYVFAKGGRQRKRTTEYQHMTDPQFRDAWDRATPQARTKMKAEAKSRGIVHSSQSGNKKKPPKGKRRK